jgi:hypothetical protein
MFPLPREHGATAEFLFPLVTGVALGAPTAGAVAFAFAALAVFLLHEPVAVMTGRRGVRRRQALRGRARTWAIVLSLTGGCAAGAALALAPGARLAALIPALLGATLAGVVVRGHEKTLAGEVLVVGVFSTVLIPVALANGATWRTAIAAAGIWFLTFTLGTVSVHAIKAGHRAAATDRWTIHGAPALAGMVALAALIGVSRHWVSVVMALAVLPGVLATFVIAARRVHPRSLRRVGWSLVGAHVVTVVLLLFSA